MWRRTREESALAEEKNNSLPQMADNNVIAAALSKGGENSASGILTTMLYPGISIRERRKTIWEILLHPIRAIEFYYALRIEKRREQILKIQVLKGDLTYQDVMIYVEGQLLKSDQQRLFLKKVDPSYR